MSVSASLNPNINNTLNPPDLSLMQLVLHVDPIVQAELVLLLLLSIWSLSIMLEKAFKMMRAKHVLKKLEAEVRGGAGPRQHDEVKRLIRSVRFPPFPAGDTDTRKDFRGDHRNRPARRRLMRL